MRTGPRITHLWPGLHQLWHEGRWRGLVIASCFALLLNTALAATFIGPELLGGTLRLGVWAVVVATWLHSAYRGLSEPDKSRGQTDLSEGDVGLFVEAQGEYLRGDWFAAETLLNQLLTRCPDDVESRLLLATMYRRTRQTDEAGRQLQKLAHLPNARRWSWEVQAEQKLLARGISELETADGIATSGVESDNSSVVAESDTASAREEQTTAPVEEAQRDFGERDAA